MTPNPHLIPLTPAVVMDLRASISTRGSADGTNDRLGVPFIVYSPSEDAFILHAYGSAQALHRDPCILGQLIRCERAEAGFIRRILSAQEPCDVATLSPDARARYSAARADEAARLHRQTQDFAEASRSRTRAIDPARIDLDMI